MPNESATISERDTNTGHRWIIAMASVVTHICLGSVYAWSVMVPAMQSQMGWSKPQLTWAFSTAIASLGFTAALAGPLMQRMGPRRSVTLSALFFGTGLCGAALALRLHSLPLLYLLYGVVGGIGLGLGYVPPVTTLMRWFADRKGLATGLAVSGFGLGALGASYLEGWLLPHMSAGSVFLVMAAIYTPLVLISAQVMRLPANAAGKPARIPASMAFRHPQFYLIWLLFFVNIAVGILLIALARPMLQEKLQMSTSAAVTVVAILGLFNGVGRLAWSALSDKLGRRMTWTIMATLQVAMFVVLAKTTSSVAFAACLWLIGSCYGGGFAICPALVADVFGATAAPRVYGFALTAWSAAALASPPLGAWMQQATGSYAAILFACAGLGVVGLMILAGMDVAARRAIRREMADSASSAHQPTSAAAVRQPATCGH